MKWLTALLVLLASCTATTQAHRTTTPEFEDDEFDRAFESDQPFAVRGSGSARPIAPAGTPYEPSGQPTAISVESNAHPRRLDSSDVVVLIRSHLPEVQRCYQSRLNQVGALQGRLVIELILQPDGEFTDVRVVDDTMGDPVVAACVVGVLDAMVLEGWQTVGTVTFQYPFVFAPR